MKIHSIAAVILAAGYSSRFKGVKPLAAIGGRTALEHSVNLFKSAGIKHICVVVGHQKNELVDALRKNRLFWVINEQFQKGMFSSVQAGVAALPAGAQAFFILPADIPLVRRQTVIDLLIAFKNAASGILYPSFNKKRGHPPLIARSYATSLLSWHGRGGLKAFLELCESDAAEVPVADEYIHRDLDTPDDLKLLRAQYARYDIPSIQECRALLECRSSLSRDVREHCAAVASAARRISIALNRSGLEMNLDLISAGALLHDLAKGTPGHARAGAKILRAMNFDRVAKIVETHMDLRPADGPHIHPDEIVYLADKLTEKTRFLPLDERRKLIMQQFGRLSKVRAAINKRMSTAKKIQQKVEMVTGKSIREILANEAAQENRATENHLSASAR